MAELHGRQLNAAQARVRVCTCMHAHAHEHHHTRTRTRVGRFVRRASSSWRWRCSSHLTRLPGYHPYQARELELEMALQLALSSARGAARRGEAERRLLGVEVHGHLRGLSMHTVGGAGAPTRGEGTYGGEGAYGVRRRGGECTRVKHGGLKGVHEGCASPCTPLTHALAAPLQHPHTPRAPPHTPRAPPHTP